MRFVTGNASLTAKPIKITGPEYPDQGVMPLGQSCFSEISIPFYGSQKELAE